MARLTRRLQILQHLMKAQEHQNEAARLVLEAEGAPSSEPPGPRSTLPPPPKLTGPERPIDPKVSTLSTNLTRVEEVTAEARARHAASKPTVHALTAFTSQTALRELSKAWEEAKTATARVRVRDTAKRLVAAGVLTEIDIKRYGD
jgi:hypothetical protein